MIIYGSRIVTVKSANSKTGTCSNCGANGSLMFHVLSKHAHIFWIPMIPIRWKYVSECQECEDVVKYKKLAPNLKLEFDNFKLGVKPPIWQFSGLILIAIFIGWGAISRNEKEKNDLVYISNPVVGDIYNYEMENGDYSTFKVSRIKSDTVFLIPNEFAIKRRNKLYKIDTEENYLDLSIGILKSELKSMFDEKTIFGIKRK